jgi:hypothetical protein
MRPDGSYDYLTPADDESAMDVQESLLEWHKDHYKE